jgi:hypothetical protein
MTVLARVNLKTGCHSGGQSESEGSRGTDCDSDAAPAADSLTRNLNSAAVGVPTRSPSPSHQAASARLARAAVTGSLTPDRSDASACAVRAHSGSDSDSDSLSQAAWPGLGAAGTRPRHACPGWSQAPAITVYTDPALAIWNFGIVTGARASHGGTKSEFWYLPYRYVQYCICCCL